MTLTFACLSKAGKGQGVIIARHYRASQRMVMINVIIATSAAKNISEK